MNPTPGWKGKGKGNRTGGGGKKKRTTLDDNVFLSICNLEFPSCMDHGRAGAFHILFRSSPHAGKRKKERKGKKERKNWRRRPRFLPALTEGLRMHNAIRLWGGGRDDVLEEKKNRTYGPK